MFWFLTGTAVFLVINFALTLAFRRWGVTSCSYTNLWDPQRKQHD